MNREKLLENTQKYLNALPDDKITEVYEFVEFLYRKHEEYVLKKGIHKLESHSKSYEFLKDEEDIYTVNDIKERYDEEG